MAVNNAYLIDGKNSYYMPPFTVLRNKSAPVGGNIDFTAQIKARGAGDTATGRFGVDWLNAKGFRISTDSQAFNVDKDRNILTVMDFQAPPGTVLMQAFIASTDKAFYFAKPKLEIGEIATAFDAIDTRKLTYLDSTGLYTGTVQANQVLVTDSERVSDAITSIRAGQVDLANSTNLAITNIRAGGLNMIGGFDVSDTKLSKINNGKYLDLSSRAGEDFVSAGLISGSTKTPNFRLLEDGSVYSAGDFTAGAGKLKYTKSKDLLEMTGEIKTIANGRTGFHMLGSTLEMHDFTTNTNAAIGMLTFGIQEGKTFAVGLRHETGHKILISAGAEPYMEFDALARHLAGYQIVVNKPMVAIGDIHADKDITLNGRDGYKKSLKALINTICTQTGLVPPF